MTEAQAAHESQAGYVVLLKQRDPQRVLSVDTLLAEPGPGLSGESENHVVTNGAASPASANPVPRQDGRRATDGRSL